MGNPNNQVFHVSTDVLPADGSECFDDDGRPKRTGTIWTASARIITAVIGSESLSLAWAIAQLGWIVGPTTMLLYALVTFYTSTLLTTCYCSGDPITGKRNYTYMDAVSANLGSFEVKLCELVQYVNLFGVATGYTIASSTSMMAIKGSNCFHEKGEKNPCHINSNPYMIAFGIVEIIFSQISHFDQLWWLSIVAAFMSFTYSIIELGLSIAKIAETGKIRGSLTGINIGAVTSTQKLWRSFQALGDITFAYSYSHILIKIQDTIQSSPSESKALKKASLISIAATTLFYMICGCMGYAAFGDMAPENLLTGFGFYNPYWMVDIANAAIVIHLICMYQFNCQPLFAYVEKTLVEKFRDSQFLTREIKISIPGYSPYKLKLFPFVWRTVFVIGNTLTSMLLPFINIVELLRALGFWPLTVFFPVEMYIKQKKIPKWRTKWVCLQIVSAGCLIITIAAAAGSIADVILNLKSYKPFSTDY
ncbi:amino acid permease 3-like [Eucalyptus grandis]|uniref:amino acid permease 3-like n=1 Tax=Eucalyptus grandis TaxID=71139 RepID=UPI00192EC604|nr:amino acid permease 3-like [Eucalyptus grandis]